MIHTHNITLFDLDLVVKGEYTPAVNDYFNAAEGYGCPGHDHSFEINEVRIEDTQIDCMPCVDAMDIKWLIEEKILEAYYT